MAEGRADLVRVYLAQNIAEQKKDVVALAATRFSLSRQTISRHLVNMVDEGILSAQGRTKGRIYTLRLMDKATVKLDIMASSPAEDEVWRNKFAPLAKDLRENVRAICFHGFTEIFNNAVEHSKGKKILADMELTYISVRISIWDNGMGIFKKIKEHLDLNDEREAILELAKGKVTTDPDNHTGEGIFFTTRMFEAFSICSGLLCFVHSSPDNDWLIETPQTPWRGTWVTMDIPCRSQLTTREIFDRYASEEGDYAFAKTHVPLSLFKMAEENLVSRSQARRVLARYDRFKEVLLDFAGVEHIGQAFADEVFRVFRKQHPEIIVLYINANDGIEAMIDRVNNAGNPSAA